MCLLKQNTLTVPFFFFLLQAFTLRVKIDVKKQLHGGLALAEKKEKERKKSHKGCQGSSDRVVEAQQTRCTIAEWQRSSSRVAEWLPVPVHNKVLEQAATVLTVFLLSFAVFPGTHSHLFIQCEAFTSIIVWI